MGETVSSSQPFLYTDAGSFSSAVISLFVTAIVAGAFLLSSDRFDHWFLIPISMCGILIGIDAIEWVRGRLGIYDPIGILGVFGVHFFFLAPLLHVKWDLWTGGVSPPPDWRDWLGMMGILNAVGLMFYRICRQTFNTGANSRRVFWEIDNAKFRVFVPACIAISALLQTWFYFRVGGIAGYMQARAASASESPFNGMGWMFMISESAPILVAFFVVVRLQSQNISWSRAAMALLALFTLQMYFGGLRGSRSETLLLLFWVVGCIHFLVRQVPRKLIYCGCVFLMVFLYVYGFYKAEPFMPDVNPTEAFSGSEQREQLEQRTGRTLKGTLLWDLGRADMQAFILYRLTEDGSDFSYAKGRTYLGALSLLIPRWILPQRPEGKLKEGTEIQSGGGTYAPEFSSSKVYGLAGESMLNFGPLSVPFAYAVFGWLVGWFRNLVNRLLPGDARFLLVPFGVYMCLGALAGDSDNEVFGLAKNGFMAFLVVVTCSRRCCYCFPRARFTWPLRPSRMRERVVPATAPASRFPTIS